MPQRPDDLNQNSDLAQFADALKQMIPAAPNLSRDALLFEAGKAANQPQIPVAFWQGLCGLCVAAVAIMAAFMTSPTQSNVVYVDRVVYLKVPEQPAPDSNSDLIVATKADADDEEDLSSEDFAKMYRVRRDVMRWGIDALPSSVRFSSYPEQKTQEMRREYYPSAGIFATPGLPAPKKPSVPDSDENEK